MFRPEFLTLVTSTGMVTLKEIRSLASDKRQDVISELGLLDIQNFDDTKFSQLMAKKFSLKYMDLSNAKIPQETLKLTSKGVIVKHRAIPIQKNQKSIMLAIYDPTVFNSLNELKQVFKMPVDLIMTNMKSWSNIFSQVAFSIEELISTVKEVKSESLDKDSISIKAEEIGEDIINIVNKILVESFIKKASDIHLEPYEKIFRVRMRIDGSLIVIAEPTISLMLPIISRIKIMAQMDIAERRMPQDGRIKLSIGGKPIDYRVSSLPTLFGEKIVMRLLDTTNLQLDMTKLGFEKYQLENFKEGIHKPFGMVLVTGPTGSGKTTTLYSALCELNTIDSNISTVEDPVEFNLEGINQVNVKKDIGLTFATALKSFLRQDPDIIMVGEIRDAETGEIAVEAALTGHLVLSTLHTNDAASTIIRLLNMGIEPFLLAGSLNVVVAQRLCRKICIGCKEVMDVKPELLVSYGIAPTSAQNLKIYHGVGCTICSGTGYKGRVAIYEVLTVDWQIRECIMNNDSADTIKKQAIKNGMKSLRMSALTKVVQGFTTLEEAVSNSGSDN